MPKLSTLADRALYPYLVAMREELYVAQRADERFEEARERWLDALERPDDDLFAAVDAENDLFSAAEQLLTAHARISLYLFPAYDRAPARGRAAALRVALGVSKDHPIGNRDARNGWMHIDQIVDRAVFERGEDFVEAYRVVRSTWPSGRKSPRNVLIVLNVDRSSLRVAGTKYDLKAVMRQVDTIGTALFRVIPDVEYRLDLEGEGSDAAS